MSISIIKRAVNRTKSIIETLKQGSGLPFQAELSPKLIEKQVGAIVHRERILSISMQK